MVWAVITLAHNLDMNATFEGIETPNQPAQILALDCDFARGCFFAHSTGGDATVCVWAGPPLTMEGLTQAAGS